LPKLVCRSCGQGVYTTAPFEQLFADERRCPRCGQLLFNDRRSGGMRRKAQRRRPPEVDATLTAAAPTNGAPTNGSPGNGDAGNGSAPHDGPAASESPMAASVTALAAAAEERRLIDRRQLRRRREDNNPFQRASEEAGWAG
jgi:hypothetical protein